jgi:hypothetical protein
LIKANSRETFAGLSLVLLTTLGVAFRAHLRPVVPIMCGAVFVKGVIPLLLLLGPSMTHSTMARLAEEHIVETP